MRCLALTSPNCLHAALTTVRDFANAVVNMRDYVCASMSHFKALDMA